MLVVIIFWFVPKGTSSLLNILDTIIKPGQSASCNACGSVETARLLLCCQSDYARHVYSGVVHINVHLRMHFYFGRGALPCHHFLASIMSVIICAFFGSPRQDMPKGMVAYPVNQRVCQEHTTALARIMSTTSRENHSCARSAELTYQATRIFFVCFWTARAPLNKSFFIHLLFPIRR